MEDAVSEHVPSLSSNCVRLGAGAILHRKGFRVEGIQLTHRGEWQHRG